jgi:hypothetical protein
MIKLFYVLAATAALALTAPTTASAEKIIIKRHDHDGVGPPSITAGTRIAVGIATFATITTTAKKP